MFLRCPICKSPTQYKKADNATLVIDGDPVCVRILCRERANDIVRCREERQRQTLEKCRELGLTVGQRFASDIFSNEPLQLPLRLDPG